MELPPLPEFGDPEGPWQFAVNLGLALLAAPVAAWMVVRAAHRWPWWIARLGICCVIWAMIFFLPGLLPDWGGFYRFAIALFLFGLGCIFLSKGFGTLSMFMECEAGDDMNESFRIHAPYVRRGVLVVVVGEVYGFYYVLEKLRGR